METNSNEVNNNDNKGVVVAVVFLGIIAFVNIVFLIGAGFSGEEGMMLFGQNLPLTTMIMVSILSFICNLYASIKIKWMVLFGGVILAAFPLLLTFNTLFTPTERPHLIVWLIFTSAIYIASFIGGILGLIFERIRK